MQNKMVYKLMSIIFSAAFVIGNIKVPLMAQDETTISNESELLAILNTTNVDETIGRLYSIEKDIVIDTDDLIGNRVFGGDIDGNNHTITIKSSKSSGPLFEKLQGSISDITFKFEGDVVGAPLAYDITYSDTTRPIKISNVDVIVDGSVVYDDHNFRDYYAAILDYPYNYGNWYIHFGCQPVHLATGFAWYLWGVILDDISVTINGDVGNPEKVEGDATSAGFAYFAVKGGADYDVIFNNIDVIVNGNIQSNTNDGHASAYGFATGDAAGTAGFGENTIEEASHININANNILSYSANGSSSSMGFARFAQGYTHDCLVNVPGKIEAVNMEGDEEEDEYAYSNGDAYAYGFILNTGGSSIASRRNFENNQVVAGNIFARTDSKEFAGSAFAAGFAHQMMNTATDVPDLSYNNNSVKIINGSITAEANAGSAVSSGFVTSSGRDYYDRPDHIFANSVYVNGSITASSKEADATATGYSYMNKTHRRDCSVEVNGDIIASSPVQSIASGFNGLQYIDNYYFINSSKVKVEGDIAAIQTGNEEGIIVAAGLNGVIMGNSSGNADTKVRFSGNTVEVYGNIFDEINDKSEGYAGLLLAYSEHTDDNKGLIEVDNNTFVGQESLIEKNVDRSAGKTLFTNFTHATHQKTYISSAGNKVKFIKDGDCPYIADLIFIEDHNSSSVGDLWLLSNISTSHNVVKVEAKNPDCTNDGNIEYWYCPDCMRYFTNEGLENEIEANEVIIKATGHDISDEWKTDETHHWHFCKKCGIKIDEARHQFVWIVDKEATNTQTGLKHEECQICKYRRASMEIAADDHDIVVPETGNNGHRMIPLLILSGIAGIIILVKTKYNYLK